MELSMAYIGVALGSQYCIGPQGLGATGFVFQDMSSANRYIADDMIWRFYAEYMISSYLRAIPITEEIKKDEVLTTEEILVQARKVLGASISDLSEMLGISRPTVYSYLSGNEPSGNSELLKRRLFLLQRTIETIGKIGLSIPCSVLLKRRDSRGKTFKELLAGDELNDEKIQAFCHGELQQRERAKQRVAAVSASSSERKSVQNEAFSVPAHLQ